MMRSTFLATLVSVLAVAGGGRAAAQVPEGGAPPPARKIPGITAEDRFPGGCVDCHVKLPDMDVRLSTLMQQWTVSVEPRLLAKAQAAAPPGVTLTGRHPAPEKSLTNIPLACLTCHGRTSQKAPPFARMLHRIHLVGGEENHFLTLFQGECTHCHKLDQATGSWSFASGPEK